MNLPERKMIKKNIAGSPWFHLVIAAGLIAITAIAQPAIAKEIKGCGELGGDEER